MLRWDTASRWTASRRCCAHASDWNWPAISTSAHIPCSSSIARRSVDQHWQNNFGKDREVRDHFNELTLTLKRRQPHLRCGGPRLQRRRRLPPHAAQAAWHGLLHRHPRRHGVHLSRRRAAMGGLEQRRRRRTGRRVDSSARRSGDSLPARISTLNPAFKYGLPVPGADARCLRRHHRVRSAGLGGHVAGS